jgi:SAM-dependent methyltransferase
MGSPQEDELRQLWNDSADAYHSHTRRYATHRQITMLLTSTVTGEPRHVLDFGCRPGNSTRALRQRFPGARLTGLDTSTAMIGIARQATGPAEKIHYQCRDVASYRTGDAGQHDLIICSNSFFHVEDKAGLLAEFSRLLAAPGHIAFSLYDSVFRPSRPLAWPLPSPSAGPGEDTLIAGILHGLRRLGHPCAARTEDRQILTEQDLAALFAAQGFAVRCAGVLRLLRTAQERAAFLRIPAVTRENFPDVPCAAVMQVIDGLDLSAGMPVQERSVYAFTADRI